MKDKKRQKIKKAYKQKTKENEIWVSKTPFIEELGWGTISGYHMVTFCSLKVLLDWYFGEKKCGVCDKNSVKSYGNDVLDVFWISVPLLVGKKEQEKIWHQRLDDIFNPNIKELQIQYEKRKTNTDNMSIKFIAAFNTFEKYLNYKRARLVAMKKNALQILSRKNVFYFAICSSNQIIVRKEIDR